MDLLNHVSHRIAALDSGEQWIVSAQKLLISRTDFNHFRSFFPLSQKKGHFSISPQGLNASYHAEPVVTISKH